MWEDRRFGDCAALWKAEVRGFQDHAGAVSNNPVF
jgi:hypothetical protein